MAVTGLGSVELLLCPFVEVYLLRAPGPVVEESLKLKEQELLLLWFEDLCTPPDRHTAPRHGHWFTVILHFQHGQGRNTAKPMQIKTGYLKEIKHRLKELCVRN